MFRVGWPGWKLAARLGLPVLVRVQVMLDKETGSYWAKSRDLDGLVVSGETLDELMSEAVAASQELLALQLSAPARAATRLTYQQSSCFA